MKVGIIGPASRTVAWEKHLAGHSSVSETVIAAELDKAGPIDACLLLNETDNNIDQAITSVKNGYHTFLISKLPLDISRVEKLFFASEEANVRLQFSHWPTIAPASQWIANKISKPSFIQCIREVKYSTFVENNSNHQALWVDELAYCLKGINSSVFQINYNHSKLKERTVATHIMLQFDNSSTASIYVNTASERDTHTRYIADGNFGIECEVESQQARIARMLENGPLFFERKKFDPALAAEQAVIKFLKAIQLKKPTLYNGYDLLRLVKTLKKINVII